MKALFRAGWAKHSSPTTALVIGLAYAVALGLVDCAKPIPMSFGVFYLAGIVFVAWRGGSRRAMLVALVSAGMMAVQQSLSPHVPPQRSWVRVWDAATQAVVLCGAAWLVGGITSLARRATTLREHRADHQSAILASAMDGFAAVDGTGRVSDVNEAYCRMVGYSRAELLGMHLAQLEAKERPEEIRRHLAVIQEQGGDRFETRHRHKDGREIHLEVSVTCAPGGNGLLVAFAREIGDRKRAELLLQAQRDLGTRLSLTSDLPTALQALLEAAVKIHEVDCGGIYLRDPISGELTLAAHCGPLSREFIAQVSHYPGESDRAIVVSKGAPVYDVYDRLPGLEDHEAPEALRAVAVVPLRYEGVVIGALNLASHTTASMPPQSRLVIEAVAAQAAGAIARIRAETERRRLELQILEISDREQGRIGQEIHDGLCQHLVSLAFDANRLQRELVRLGRPEGSIASRIADSLDQAITEARQLSRGLFPIRLDAEGLISGLEELARGTRARFGIDCVFECSGPLPVQNPATATHLFRIAQEAVNNSVKHGRARSISIRLVGRPGRLQLEVQDDGIGAGADVPAKSGGMGLHIMNYRARSIGGSFSLSPGPHGGTVISCCIPRQQSEKLGW